MIYLLLAAYNEEQNLPGLLEEIAAQLKGLPYRVILVNDGSTDHTREEAAKLSTRVNLHLIDHLVNRGLGSALSTGFGFIAGEMTPRDCLVTMDADQTHPVTLIPSMLDQLARGTDVVIASRFCRGGKQFGLALSRRLISSLASAVLRLLWPARRARDYTSGYRLFSGKTVRAMAARYGDRLIEEKGFAATLELLLKASRLTSAIEEVPLQLHYERKKSASKMRIAKTVREYILLLFRQLF